jgi:hypothetical protein
VRKELSFVEKVEFFKTAFEENLAIEREKQAADLQKLKEKYPAVTKSGPLLATTWLFIYFTQLSIIYLTIDSGIIHDGAFGVDFVAAKDSFFTWIENNLFFPFIPSLVNFLRENPKAANFASAYILTDLMPTSIFAAAAFPVVSFLFGKSVVKSGSGPDVSENTMNNQIGNDTGNSTLCKVNIVKANND